MQATIYYRKEDTYLFEKLEERASRERRSRSAYILSILEEHLEGKNKIGEILMDMGLLTREELQQSLKIQSDTNSGRLLGEILLEKGFVEERDLKRALGVQAR